MPSDKRARKRAAREAKMAALERQRKRRAAVRRGVTLVVIVGVAIGIFALVSGGGSKKKAAGKSNASTTTTTSATAEAQAKADAASEAAGCPSNPSTKLSKPSWSSPPAMTIDTSQTYTATVETDVGTFTVALDPAEAPTAVNSFVFLTEHDFFNCVIFHRVVPGFVIQGGDPTGTGTGGPGYEFTEAGPPAAADASQQYPLYSVAMANSSSGSTDPSTNGSQFFIVTGTQGESLPPDYVLFGKVTSGFSVIQQINDDGNANPSASGVPPKVTHRMLKVTIS